MQVQDGDKTLGIKIKTMTFLKTNILFLSLFFASVSCSSTDDTNEIDKEEQQEEVVVLSTIAPFFPINFETIGFGADWTWSVFENGSNPALEIVENPFKSGINTSSNVAKFTALVEGAAWVGCETKHGEDIGTFKFDASNSTVKIMVYKTVISDVGLKFAEANGDAQLEVKVANTKINEWEELTFDLSGSIGAGATGNIDQLIIFPDFNSRNSNNIIYFDNIKFEEQ